jgi:hypothetical protein
MSAESLFNAYLTGLPDVTNLVAAARIITGDVQSNEMAVPYVTLNVTEKRGPEGTGIVTKDGELIVDIFAGTRSAGKGIAEALSEALHNTAMTSGDNHIEYVRLESQSDLQEPDGAFHFTQTYEFRIQ